jgi:hypothetical protein
MVRASFIVCNGGIYLISAMTWFKAFSIQRQLALPKPERQTGGAEKLLRTAQLAYCFGDEAR